MKAYSKAAKRKSRKALPKLECIEPRKKRGGARMKDIENEDIKTNLEARLRQMGKEPEAIEEMRAQMLGEGAGQALYILCTPDTAKRLWGHYVAITSSEARYHRSLGKSIHAKTAKIEFMTETFETRDDDVIDIRTEEERDRDAVRRWMIWQGYIMRIHGHLQSAIYAAYRHHRDLVVEGKVTSAGKLFVEAMGELDKRIT